LSHELPGRARIWAELARRAWLIRAHGPPTILSTWSHSNQARGQGKRAGIAFVQSRLLVVLCPLRVQLHVSVSMLPLEDLQLHRLVGVLCFGYCCQQYNSRANGGLLLQESHRVVVDVLSPSARARIAAKCSCTGVAFVDLACRSTSVLARSHSCGFRRNFR
jgi:hypothetical protein